MPPERPNKICPSHHQHGRTSACYKTHMCRCQPCRDGAAKRERARRAGFQAGIRRRNVDPSRAGAHLRALYDAGMTQRHVAQLAGLAEITLRRIAADDVPWIFASTERAILAIKPTRSVTAGRRVDATGARRRMQALMAIGYGATHLARMLGMSKNAGPNIMRAEFVVEETRVAVFELYEKLAMTPAADSSQTRRIRGFAEKNGYAPPLAWDDDTIDDPEAKPAAWKRGQRERGLSTRLDDAVVQSALDGHQPEMSPAERRQAVTVLNERRWSAGRIAQWIDCNVKTVDRIREELSLPIYDFADVLAAA